MKTLYGFPGIQTLVMGLLSLLLCGVGEAAELGAGVGMSSGSYATRFDNLVTEVNTRSENRRWELALGYIADQENSCDRYCDEVPAYGYASVTRIVLFPITNDIDIVMGLGLMAASDTSALLSRATNISVQAGVEVGRVRLVYRHFSNGGTESSNYGQNLLLLGYRF
jgi:hypothetical protein